MKILISGFAKLKYMPYLNFYLNNLDCKKDEIHIIYWNRDLKKENLSNYDKNIKFHEFKCFQEDDVNKLTKLKSFKKYKNYVNTIIDKEKFDFIIILHTFPGVLIKNTLLNITSPHNLIILLFSTFIIFTSFPINYLSGQS